MATEEKIILSVETNGVEKIDSAKQGIDELKVSADNFNNETSNEFVDGMKNMGNSADKLTKEVNKNGDAMKQMRNDIRKLKSDLLNLDEGSIEYKQTLQEVANKTLQLKDMNDAVRVSAMDLGAKIENVVRVTGGLASAFSVGQAAIGLFGSESEELNAVMLKTQQAIALVQGLGGLEGLTKSIPALISSFKNLKSNIGIDDVEKLGAVTNNTTADIDRLTTTQNASIGSQLSMVEGNRKIIESAINKNKTIEDTIEKVSIELSSLEAVKKTAEDAFSNESFYFDSQNRRYGRVSEEITSVDDKIQKVSENLRNITDKESSSYRKMSSHLSELNEKREIEIGLRKQHNIESLNNLDNLNKEITYTKGYKESLEEKSKALNKTTEATKAASSATKGFFSGLAKATLITAAITIAITALFWIYDKLKESIGKTNIKINESIDIQKRLSNAIKDSKKDIAEENSKLNILYNTSINDKKSKEERLAAVKKLKKEYPEYFSQLKDEDIMLGKASAKYKDLKKYIIQVATAKAYSNTITENAVKIQEKDNERIGAITKQVILTDKLNKAEQERLNLLKTKYTTGSFIENQEKKIDNLKKEIQTWKDVEKTAIESIDTINKENDKLANKITIVVPEIEEENKTKTTNTTSKELDDKKAFNASNLQITEVGASEEIKIREDYINKQKTLYEDLQNWKLGTLLNDNQRELVELDVKYKEEYNLLEGNLDAQRLLTEKYNSDVFNINKKYSDMNKESKLASQMADLEFQSEQLLHEADLINESLGVIAVNKINKAYELNEELLRIEREYLEEQLRVEGITVEERIKLQDKLRENQVRSARNTADKEEKTRQGLTKSTISFAKTMNDGLVKLADDGNEKQTELEKGAGAAGVAIDTAQAIIGTWAGYSSMGPWGIAGAAAQTAMITALGIKSIKDIYKVDNKNQPEIAGGAPPVPNINQIIPENIRPTKNILTNSEIELQNKSQKVYVVMDDINEVGKKVDVIQNETTF